MQYPQTNLEAYWPIEPGQTNTLTDRSGNNHNVTLPTASYTNTPASAPVSQDDYRYGFNGQEKSNEIKGEGNSYTAMFWVYDPRLGRIWNVDPVIKPWQSDYATFSNNPIVKVDPNGDDDFFNSDGTFAYRTKTGTNIKMLTQQGAKLLSEIQPNNASNMRAMAKVVAYYAPRASIPAGSVVGISASSPNVADATTNETDKKPSLAFASKAGIFVSAKNGISAKLNNYNNLVNALVHEEKHKEAGDPEKEKGTFSDHVSVYEKQIADKSFNSTDQSFKTGIASSYVSYLLGALNTGEIDNDTFDEKISTVNSKLKDFGIAVKAKRELGSYALKPIKIFVKADDGKWQVTPEPVKAQVTPN